jgi:hypothetical protein
VTVPHVLGEEEEEATRGSQVAEDASTLAPTPDPTPPSPFKFPTPQERIKYYMGSWYDTDKSIDPSFCKQIRIANGSSIPNDVEVLYPRSLLYQRLRIRNNWLTTYLKDAANILTHIESKVPDGFEEDKFVILRIGDSATPRADLPIATKSRPIMKNDEAGGFSPLVWPLGMTRHYYSSFEDFNKIKDTPWEEKVDTLLWRGACTGVRDGSHHNGSRLTFVKRYALSKRKDIDIGMVGSCSPFGVSLGGEYFKHKVNMQDSVRYKYILSLEGNDVSTGLKWQLASSSVVFLATPSTETFAMEGLLVPFIHYIPVENDGSDLEEMLEWAKENDQKAKWISAQATQFMNDLWLSDKAKQDNILIRNELANIYHHRFGKELRECYNKKKR